MATETLEEKPHSHHNHIQPIPLSDNNHSESDTTVTNSSDEFDWYEDEGVNSSDEKIVARRGRAIWIAFMKLSKLVRVLLVGMVVAAISLTPLLVVELRFKGNLISSQVHFWSLWLTITWAAGCITYLLVDSIPHVVVSAMLIFGARVEQRKIHLEVRMHWLRGLGSITANLYS